MHGDLPFEGMEIDRGPPRRRLPQMILSERLLRPFIEPAGETPAGRQEVYDAFQDLANFPKRVTALRLPSPTAATK